MIFLQKGVVTVQFLRNFTDCYIQTIVNIGIRQVMPCLVVV